jgi:glycosyltransferase involved in cell wall biosynthesis
VFKLSVALSTFNGSKYLKAQLNSIVCQTRPPDELIICDDRSSDDTVKIVDEFSNNVPFVLKFIVNDDTLGPTNNFDKGIRICTGDLIALSDQDDVWHPQKLRKCEEIFETRREVGAVFSNADVVDDSLTSLGYDMWKKTKFTSIEQQQVESGNAVPVLLKHYVVTGATLVFRADFKSSVLPIPPFWFHDAWIALVLASISNLAFVCEPMMKYRQHSANQLGGLKKDLKRQVLDALQISRNDYYKLEIDRYQTLHRRLLSLASNPNVSKAIPLIEDKIKHLQERQQMPKNRFLRIPFIASKLMRSGYARYARNWGSVAMDLFFK